MAQKNAIQCHGRLVRPCVLRTCNRPGFEMTNRSNTFLICKIRGCRYTLQTKAYRTHMMKPPLAISAVHRFLIESSFYPVLLFTLLAEALLAGRVYLSS